VPFGYIIIANDAKYSSANVLFRPYW